MPFWQSGFEPFEACDGHPPMNDRGFTDCAIAAAGHAALAAMAKHHQLRKRETLQRAYCWLPPAGRLLK